MRRYKEVIAALPDELQHTLELVPEDRQGQIQEIRLRAGRPVVLVSCGTTYFLCLDRSLVRSPDDNCVGLTREMLEQAYRKLCEYSVHSNIGSLTQGYLTIRGGHRVGVCSTAVYKEGEIYSVKDVSSLNLRIARAFPGTSVPVLDAVLADGASSIILAGKPSSGKTTVLRDMACQLSSGYGGQYRRVSIVDERSEIAGAHSSMAQNDVGINTDVLNGFQKPEGIGIAVRTLSPEYIVCDEIGTMQEVEAIRYGFSSGVEFIVSLHMNSREELYRKPQLQALLDTGQFRRIVLLREGFRGFDVYDTDEVDYEIHRNCHDRTVLNADWAVSGQ
ncbi:MAG: hypothetical protein LIO46_06435 [Clostridiales bacterium]|nr:hypothetical protein [Clostridiales bacterium]